MKQIGNGDKQETGRWLNNRCENSHQPFRRRELAMQRFRLMRTLQKFTSVNASFHIHFNQERHSIAGTISSTTALPLLMSGGDLSGMKITSAW
jgi:transposase-like protein